MRLYKGFIIRSKIRFNIKLGYEWWEHGCTNQADIRSGTGLNIKHCKQQIDRLFNDICSK